MVVAQPRRVARLGGALLLVAALACGCVPGTPPTTPSPTEPDDVVDALEYAAADILSVDLVEVSDPESIEGCSQWHVQFMVEEEAEDWMGSAWYSHQACIDDEEAEEQGVPFVKMTAKQVADFRAILAQVGINNWNAWLEDNADEPDLETPEITVFTVSVLVENLQGVFYDAITVAETPPPEWDAFVAAIKSVTGDG